MKKIVIIPNESKDIGLSVTKKLIDILKNKARLYMDIHFEQTGFEVIFVESKRLFEEADFAVVLGGDGTILNVAEPCARRNIPIMGINLGKVGFMTEIDVSDMENACMSLINGDFTVEKRMMMKIILKKDDREVIEYNALNDLVISKSDSPMIEIEVKANNEKVNEYKADGLIIATPTGSTGYSLSAGGPVADPTMELFIASPICAHMLHARPALMPSEKPIVLSILDGMGKLAVVTVDGNVKEHITVGDEIIIRKSDYYAEIIKIGHQSFYDVLIDKLK